MTDGTKLGLLVLVLALIAGYRFATHAIRALDAPPGVVAGMPHPANGPAVQPSKDNVSHALRLEETQLQQRLATAPDDTTALLRMARLLHDGHRPGEAVSFYERYLRLAPANRQAWLDLATIYAERAQWDQARTCMESLLAAFPDDPAALYNLGAICANQGDAAAAKDWWEKTRDQQADPALAAQAVTSLHRLAAMNP